MIRFPDMRLLLLLLLTMSAAQAVETLPFDELVSKHRVTDVTLSPDGAFVAVLLTTPTPESQSSNLATIDLASDTAYLLTGYSDMTVRWYAWASDQRLLFATGRAAAGGSGAEYRGSLAINRDGSGATRLDSPRSGQSLSFLARVPADPAHVLLLRRQVDSDKQEVLRFNLARRSFRKVAESDSSVTGWLADHQGELRIALAHDANTGQRRLRYRQDESQAFADTLDLSANAIRPLAFHGDNRSLIAAIRRDKANYAIVRADPLSGKLHEALVAERGVDVWSAQHSRLFQTVRGLPVYYRYRGPDGIRQVFFDPRWQMRQDAIDDAISGDNMIAAASDDERRLLVRSSSDDGNDYYLYDTVAGELRFLLSLTD
ncbi:MAG: hypothetical protein HKN49_03620 [Gammaproteobacteria bacterium]|nr:hypothetical protein [Gammaproteobacteria bacterium]